MSNPPANNPLVESHLLPPFTEIKAEHVVPAITHFIERNTEQVDAIVAAAIEPTWDNFVYPMEVIDDQLSQAWSPVGHLNGVQNSEQLRQAYNEALVKITEFSTAMGQHKGMYQGYQAMRNSPEFDQLSQAQQKTIDNALRDFTLTGIGLPEAQQQQFAANSKRLSELSSQFSNNVLDATHGWYHHVTQEQELAGLPASAIALAKQAAADKSLSGWVITLDIPAYLAVMTHAENRPLRAAVYRAYTTRASQLGQQADGASAAHWDNSPLITETLALRQQQAELLGFDNYAELSLARKMAQSPQQVEDFLLDLADHSKAMAEQELTELRAFAAQDGIAELEAWDVAYYSEQLKQSKHAVSQEAIRPYFPAEKVVTGLFEVASRLFGLAITEDANVATWHPDARYFRVARDGQEIAGFYLDMYARAHKRGGAWMDVCRTRRTTDQGIQLPVAYLTCNFTPPSDALPALLTHNEVTTLFHEFGHGLHHMLTQVDVAAVSGISGVEWDAVELPSQFLENWCWHPEVLTLLSGHYQTGEPLPEDLLHKMLDAKNFQSGMMMLRQIEFALFDLRLHWHYPQQVDKAVAQVLAEVRQRVAVLQPPAFNRFENSFSHIFAGGYAAGYYSYKWAEVLSADAFSVFEENGIFDPDSGQRFLQTVLQQGGSRDANTLFVAFRGREPNNDALLRHSGINVAKTA